MQEPISDSDTKGTDNSSPELAALNSNRKNPKMEKMRSFLKSIRISSFILTFLCKIPSSEMKGIIQEALHQSLIMFMKQIVQKISHQ